MAVPTMEESALCSQLIERVKDYFQSAEHKKEFDAAVKQVIHDQVSDPKLDGMGKLLIPLTGVIFAKDVKKILFGETEENKED